MLANEPLRRCYACDSDITYKDSQGKQFWYLNRDTPWVLCSRCYHYHILSQKHGPKQSKGGSYTDTLGYIRVRLGTSAHPRVGYKGFMHEHILRYEEFYKCCILPWTVIHHIDHNKRNNDITNLQPVNESQHRKIHAIEYREKCEERGFECPRCRSRYVVRDGISHGKVYLQCRICDKTWHIDSSESALFGLDKTLLAARQILHNLRRCEKTEEVKHKVKHLSHLINQKDIPKLRDWLDNSVEYIRTFFIKHKNFGLRCPGCNGNLIRAGTQYGRYQFHCSQCGKKLSISQFIIDCIIFRMDKGVDNFQPKQEEIMPYLVYGCGWQY